MNDNQGIFDLIYALAGRLLDTSIPKEQRTVLLVSLRDTIHLAVNVLSIATFEDTEGSFGEEDTPGNMRNHTPADILRELADAWDQQIGEEGMEDLLKGFREAEGSYQADKISKSMPETLTVEDILGENQN